MFPRGLLGLRVHLCSYPALDGGGGFVCMGFQSPTWSREVLSTVLLMEAVPRLVFPQHVHSPSTDSKFRPRKQTALP